MRYKQILKRQKQKSGKKKKKPPIFNLWNGMESMANIVKQQNIIIIDIICKYKDLDETQSENMKKQFIKPQSFIPDVKREKKVLRNGKNKISKKNQKKNPQKNQKKNPRKNQKKNPRKNQKKIPNKRIRKKLIIKKKNL